MANWKMTIDITDIWNHDIDFEEHPELLPAFNNKIVTRLSSYIPKVQTLFGEDIARDFESLIDELELCDNVEDFNSNWNEIYNFADLHKIWIAVI